MIYPVEVEVELGSCALLEFDLTTGCRVPVSVHCGAEECRSFGENTFVGKEYGGVGFRADNDFDRSALEAFYNVSAKGEEKEPLRELR